MVYFPSTGTYYSPRFFADTSQLQSKELWLCNNGFVEIPQRSNELLFSGFSVIERRDATLLYHTQSLGNKVDKVHQCKKGSG